MGKPDFRERWVEKLGQSWKNCHFSRDSRENCYNFCPERIKSLFLHVLHLNSPSFYVKCPRKCQKPIILTFFSHLPKFTPLSLLNSGMDPKFDQVSNYSKIYLYNKQVVNTTTTSLVQLVKYL